MESCGQGRGGHEYEEGLGRWRSVSRPWQLIWAKRDFGSEETAVMWSGSMGMWFGVVAVGKPGEPGPSTGSLAWRHLLSCCTSLVFRLLPVIAMKVL